MSRKSVVLSIQPMYVLEESFYPDTWQDDSRMGVLLAEFRVRSVNPENYDSKMKFWKEMIRNYCNHKGSALVSIIELKQVFKRKGTSPYCLQVVFDDMIREKQLLSSEQFRKESQESWTGWAVDVFIRKPVGWGFGVVKDKLIGSSQDENAEFVCLEVVMKQADVLEKFLQEQNKHNILISMEDFTDLTKNSGMSIDGINLVLHHMVRQQRVYIDRSASETREENKWLLKFAVPGAKAQPITDIERSIYNLEQTEQDLLKIVDKLDQDIADSVELVKGNIREGKKQLAKSNLKKKHLLEKNLEKKMNVLENVQTMLSRIHDSQSDRNVIEAYKLGSNALKNAFASSGITLDSVDDTLAEMKEIMDQQDEMQTMIGSTQTADVDELELEKELSDLIDMKLAESNIQPSPISLESPVPKAPAAVSGGQSTLAQLNDFDKEIEKRLAALRMESPSPPFDTSMVNTVSKSDKTNVTSVNT
ncbi:charged multivesicular body protein 7 [Topomyia yanbarensis]|uniref:charged multivesicular body protein 7 n=1 Tax=Topomyia yanbarensis TaxID=2498891 RepID=UPI00273A8731|nr:charged multivesicular body protein 7 [Topomyia yanbarensis]XP_058832437.1 charged multivesicular body protein 7 [Topomyia yanbarensis]